MLIKMNPFTEKVRNHFREIIRIKTSPHSIALGFAIGTFIKLLPTPGLNILLALLVVIIYKKVNKFALFGALLFWNPVFIIPLYTLSYEVGNMLFGATPVIKYNIVILDHIYNFSRRFLVGNLIISTTISILSYPVVKYAAILFRRSKPPLSSKVDKHEAGKNKHH